MILTKSIPVGMVVCRWKCNPVRHFHQSIVQIRHILLADKKIRARFGKPVFLSILLKKRLGHNLEIQYFESIKTLPWLTFIFWGRHPYSQYIGISQKCGKYKNVEIVDKSTLSHQIIICILTHKITKKYQSSRFTNTLRRQIGGTF